MNAKSIFGLGIAFWGALSVVACSAANVATDGNAGGKRSLASNGLQPAQLPDNVAGANLAMDCAPSDSWLGDGYTNLECLFTMSENRVFAGPIAVSDASVALKGQSSTASPRVAQSSRGAFQAIYFDSVKVLEVPNLVMNANVSLSHQPYSGRFLPSAETFSQAKIKDTLDPSPNLELCGKQAPTIVDLSSDQGTCPNGGAVVFWSRDASKMACCAFKDPTVLMPTGAPKVAVRNMACLQDRELMVGFASVASKSVRCVEADLKRVTVPIEMQVPALLNPTLAGVSSSVTDQIMASVLRSAFSVVNVSDYPDGSAMLASFGGKTALGCRYQFAFQGLSDVGDISATQQSSNPALAVVKNVIVPAMDAASKEQLKGIIGSDVLPKCRKLDAIVKY